MKLYIYIFSFFSLNEGKKILLRLNIFRHKGREIVGKFACYASGLGVSLILIAHDDNIMNVFLFFVRGESHEEKRLGNSVFNNSSSCLHKL